MPDNLCKAASLRPSWPRRKSWKQQGTLKGGCNLAGVPLQCTPPWPSVWVVIVDIFFPWALAHLIPDLLHSPMAGGEVVERLSAGRRCAMGKLGLLIEAGLHAGGITD